MAQRRHGDPVMGVPVMDAALDVVVVLVEAVVLAGASGRAMAEAAATGEDSAGVELTLHGEDGSIPV